MRRSTKTCPSCLGLGRNLNPDQITYDPNSKCDACRGSGIVNDDDDSISGDGWAGFTAVHEDTTRNLAFSAVIFLAIFLAVPLCLALYALYR